MIRAFLFAVLISSAALGAELSPFLTDAKAAFALAKKSKKPLFVDFYGIWCPPCNQLDELVFSHPDFRKKGEKFVLLKVDADDPKSFALKSKYDVGGYPTVLLLAPNGDETMRFVGFRALRPTLALMDEALAAKGESFTKACTKKDTDSLWRCATVCSERKDEKCVRKALAALEGKVPAKSFLAGEARSLATSLEPTPEGKRLGLEGLLRDFPEHPRALYWAAEYWDSFEGATVPPASRQYLEDVLTNFDVIRRSPDAERVGLTEGDALQGRAYLLSALGKERDATIAWNSAAQYLEDAASQLPAGSTSRGFTLDRIGCLEQAGRLDEALALTREYQKKYHDEFTFSYRAASLLWKKKKPEEALPLAEAAYKTSYGDNRLRVVTLLVRILASQGQKLKAADLVRLTLADLATDPKLHVRTHKYVAELKKTASEAGIATP